MNNSIERRLAIACSRGTKQTLFIEELLSGPVRSQYQDVLYFRTTTWGATALPAESAQSLLSRLKEAGFLFRKVREDDGTYTLTMFLFGVGNE